MAAKLAHKVLGVEIIPTNSGHNAWHGDASVFSTSLTWASLSGAQQALLEGRNKRQLGQASPS